ncbi:MAG: copper resistance protein CopC [Methylococcaceae bacterium]|nr:copper resistance protein CopC [Methylococcaceae bacterium]MDP3904765.1 copper resistance protein CopC [Methylococcaceae bacterium]
MKKIFSSILLSMLLVQTHNLYAHAVITDYSLKITPIYANKPDQVELSFNSKIELGLSQVFLVRKGDKHELLEVTNGKKQGQIIIHIPALETGDYALRFKVFAADGHLTEDIIRFKVSQ